MGRIEKILVGFLNKDLPPTIGIRNYKTMKELNLLLSAIAAYVHYNCGNGALGYPSLTVSTAVYDTLAGCGFTAPTNLRTTVTIFATSTSPQIAAPKWTHKTALKDWDEFNAAV